MADKLNDESRVEAKSCFHSRDTSVPPLYYIGFYLLGGESSTCRQAAELPLRPHDFQWRGEAADDLQQNRDEDLSTAWAI